MGILSAFFGFIIKVVLAIVCGTFTIALVGGYKTIKTFGYMIYYYIRYGNKKFVAEFVTK